MMIKDLIGNVSLLIVLSLIYGNLYRRQNTLNLLNYKILTGFLFGIIAIMGMIIPWQYITGVIIDGRTIVLSIAGLFGGGIVVTIAMVIATIFRILVGGAGMAVGLGLIISSGIIGYLFHLLVIKKSKYRNLLYIYLMGFAVHIVMILLMFGFPETFRSDIMHQLSLPILVIFPIATVIVGMILIGQEDYFNSQIKLSESEKRYRIIFNQAAIGVAQVDAETGKFIRINQRYSDILGLPIDQLMNTSFQEITHPEDLPDNLENLRKIKDGETHSFTMEKRYFQPDGSIVWVNLHVAPMWEPEDKQHYYFIAAIEDITQRKKYEQQINSLNKALEAAQRMAKVGYWSYLIDEEKINWSEQMYWVYGLEKAEKPPNLFENKDAWFPGDMEILNEAVQNCMKGKDFNIVTRMKFADGEYHYINSQGIPIKNNKGKVVEYFGISQDLTDQKKFEETLLKNQKMLKDSQRIAQMGSWELELPSRKVFWSKELYAIYGYKDYEIQPDINFFMTLVHPDDRDFAKKHLEETIETKEFKDFENRVIRQDGKIIHTLIAGEVIVDDAGNPVRMYGIVQDVTERKQSELELEKHRMHLEELIKERTAELEQKNAELEQFNQLFIGREYRIKELKDKIIELENRLAKS